jgi:hypothetical protein
MSKPPEQLITMMAKCHLDTQGHDKTEYSLVTPQVIARVMCKFNDLCTNSSRKKHSFVETFSLKAGLKQFGQEGYDAAHKEMKQLHDQVPFRLINASQLTQQEKRKTMKSLIS